MGHDYWPDNTKFKYTFGNGWGASDPNVVGVDGTWQDDGTKGSNDDDFVDGVYTVPSSLGAVGDLVDYHLMVRAYGTVSFAFDEFVVEEYFEITYATLSDLNVDGTTIHNFNPNTITYDVTLPYGSTTIPPLGATTSAAAASKVITDAATLPGSSTVVVTAEDGITTITYTVNFKVARYNLVENGGFDDGTGWTVVDCGGTSPVLPSYGVDVDATRPSSGSGMYAIWNSTGDNILFQTIQLKVGSSYTFSGAIRGISEGGYILQQSIALASEVVLENNMGHDYWPDNTKFKYTFGNGWGASDPNVVGVDGTWQDDGTKGSNDDDFVDGVYTVPSSLGAVGDLVDYHLMVRAYGKVSFAFDEFVVEEVSNTWTGTTDSNWSTPENWNPQITPVSTNNVLIPSTVASGNWPVISSSVTINSLIIYSTSKQATGS